ncbi:MAG: peptidylprolyl isomerase [Sporichthyaceae bacterium]
MTRTLRTAGVAAALTMALLTAGCGEDGAEAISEPAPAGSGTSPGVTNPKPAAAAGECTYRENPGEETGEAKPTLPKGKPGSAAKYATISTSLGDIVLELDAAAAPCTVHSFVNLAQQKFYDGTFCHRLLDESGGGNDYAVLQCGDPTGTGSGGPGYQFANENLDGAKYAKGVVAMANAGPDTNGSQFFMMFRDSDFSPDYSPFATILKGVDVLEKVADGGRSIGASGSQDVPKTRLTFKKVTISETKPA